MTMQKTRYLIVGGGMAADAAAEGIRELDAEGQITILGAERHPPYNRPPLTKALWKGDPEESVWRPFNRAGVELVPGRKAVALDVVRRNVTDDAGSIFPYDKLLLATGGTPRRIASDGGAVTYYRTLDDYRSIRAATGAGKKFVVIGGGFIGAELAAALAMNGQSVTIVFPEAGIGARVFPAEMSKALVTFYEEKGVRVRTGAGVEKIEGSGNQSVVFLKGGATLDADVVVGGLGIIPNVDLAKMAGLKVEDGIVVDDHLRTSNPDVFAAGDVARFPSAVLGQSMRVEHEDAALSQGKHAGRAMAGDTTPYTHVPFFYSDLFDLGYEAVGEIDSRLPTVADWKTPNKEGVVYYLRDGRVNGVLLVNTWGQVDKARALLATRKQVQPSELMGKLPA
jgi:NAD(P)H-nitrite reductase large subunit